MSHLEPLEVAAFIDRTLDPVARRVVEEHLADCAECRADVLAAGRIAGPPPAARPATLPRALPWLAAAAALLVVATQLRSPAVQHREPAVQSAVAPGAIAPMGEVTALAPFLWNAVPGADRYRVSLFDGDGRLLWESVVSDTVATLPAEVAASITPAVGHHWSVRARVGWERWTESGLVEFRLRDPAAP